MKLFEKLFNKKDKKEEIKDKELDMEYENLIYACRKLNLINAEGQMKNDKKHLIEMLEERNILFKKYRLDNVDILFILYLSSLFIKLFLAYALASYKSILYLIDMK